MISSRKAAKLYVRSASNVSTYSKTIAAPNMTYVCQSRGKQVVTEIVHVVRRLIERREPADGHVGFVKQLVRQLENLLKQLRVQQETKQAERKRRRNARGFATPDIDKQHEK